MPTKLEVYNLALLEMRASTLALITENVEARHVLDAQWDHNLDEMLEAGFWKFAMRTVSITEDTSITENFAHPYPHNMPSDWVKTYIVSANEYLEPPLDDFVEEANTIFAKVTPIYMRYVSNSSTGYGGDLLRWTARFTRACACRLASVSAGKAIGASADMIRKLEERADTKLLQALSFEALREPSKRAQQGLWASAGGSRGARSRTGHYWDR